MKFTNSVTLRGQFATLEPLSPSHESALIDAVKDGELWNLWFTDVPSPEKVGAEIERRLALQAEGKMLPFSVKANTTDRFVGMTTFMNIEEQHRRVEIGSTWYSASVQRTPINTECKLLLLRHAFEVLNCITVEFRTHHLNRRSRAAIERLGAKLDGILRNNRILANGTIRDTCVYSIIASEWPAIREHLQYALIRPRENRE